MRHNFSTKKDSLSTRLLQVIVLPRFYYDG